MVRRTENELEEALSPDETLVDFTRRGCDSAFAVLVARYGDAVYSIARNMCATANEADDVTHQTFISAYGEIASIPADATFRNWLFATAIKTSLAERRRGRVNALRSAQPFSTAWSEDRLPKPPRGKWPDLADSAVESGKLAEPLREALGRMDDGVRAAFVLCDLAELPAKETAAILQTSRRETLLRVHRARLMLMNVLGRCFQDFQPDMSGLHP